MSWFAATNDRLRAPLALGHRHVKDSQSIAHQLFKLRQALPIVAAERVDRLAWVPEGDKLAAGTS